MYAEFLSESFDVIEAGDGLTAWDALVQGRADIVVTDLALPRMDGFQLLQRLQEDEKLKGIPVIALSGYSSSSHQTRARELGAVAVLEKPCLPEHLARAVAGAISGRKDQR